MQLYLQSQMNITESDLVNQPVSGSSKYIDQLESLKHSKDSCMITSSQNDSEEFFSRMFKQSSEKMSQI